MNISGIIHLCGGGVREVILGQNIFNSISNCRIAYILYVVVLVRIKLYAQHNYSMCHEDTNTWEICGICKEDRTPGQCKKPCNSSFPCILQHLPSDTFAWRMPCRRSKTVLRSAFLSCPVQYGTRHTHTQSGSKLSCSWLSTWMLNHLVQTVRLFTINCSCLYLTYCRAEQVT